MKAFLICLLEKLPISKDTKPFPKKRKFKMNAVLTLNIEDSIRKTKCFTSPASKAFFNCLNGAFLVEEGFRTQNGELFNLEKLYIN